MKRMTIAVVLVGLLVGLAGTAGAQPVQRAAGVNKVYRDCVRDGRLDGDYGRKLLRRALLQMPADLAEYSACPRAIRRVLVPAAARDVRRIHRQCARDGRVRDGFAPRLLRRALRTLPADLADYSSCPVAIRAAMRRARDVNR